MTLCEGGGANRNKELAACVIFTKRNATYR